MTRQQEVLKKLRKAARSAGYTFEFSRSGGNHDIYDLDGVMIVVPRHRDINELTTVSIYRAAEAKLGEKWWK